MDGLIWFLLIGAAIFWFFKDDAGLVKHKHVNRGGLSPNLRHSMNRHSNYKISRIPKERIFFIIAICLLFLIAHSKWCY